MRVAGCGVQGAGCRVQGAGCRVQSAGGYPAESGPAARLARRTRSMLGARRDAATREDDALEDLFRVGSVDYAILI